MSAEGKEKSAKNSKKHGLTGKLMLTALERERVGELINKLRKRYDAGQPQQAMLIDRVITATLRLDRARTLLTHAIEDKVIPDNPRRQRRLELVGQVIANTHDLIQETYGGTPPSYALSRTVAMQSNQIFTDIPSSSRATISKLVNYAKRFRGERDRALARLEAMRKSAGQSDI